MSLLNEFKAAIRNGLTDNSLTTCSRWAARRRFLPPLDRDEKNTDPQPYSWKFHPWVRDMHDSEASFNYAMKGAQLGVTEVCINRSFFVLDQLKRDVLYVMPTFGNAQDFSKGRFTTALNYSPYLKQLFTNTNTVSLKQTATNNLYIRGSRGDSNLKSIPVSELILDEVDEMDEKQFSLALERLSGQLRKCVWGISTPTIPKKGIHKLYLTGTQEHFHFKCPGCSRHTELVWPDCVEIIGESVYDPRCKESFLKCKECGKKLAHEEKPDWLSEAEWVSTKVDPNYDIRSFHISQLYSFTITPGELAVAFHRGRGSESATKEFHNSKLGLPYISEDARVTDEQIDLSIREHSMAGDRPKSGGRRLITLGVDQGKTSYYTVCEWLVDRLDFDVNSAAMCKVLAAGTFPDSDWHMLDILMREWQVLACVIDADPEVHRARQFAKRYLGYVWLCRYRGGKTAKEIGIAEEESGAPIATVDRTNWLDATLGRYRRQRIMLPADIPFEFKEHMKALARTYELDDLKNPVATYVDTEPDHFAHALNYAEIALPLAATITTGEDVKKFL